MADHPGFEPGSGGGGGGGGGAEITTDVTDIQPTGTRALGTGDLAAPARHVHAHGTHAGGSLHALAVASVSHGFISSSDQAKIESITVASIPSADQKAALAGTDGTPGSGNKYVTASDSRLSDARAPTDHAADHLTGGGDAIQLANASQPGLMSAAYATKVDGVESGADVTDFANVSAALAAASAGIAVNGQKITGLGTPTTGTDAATKAYVDAAVGGGGGGGGGDATSIQGVAVDATTPTTGQILELVGGSWVPTTRAALTAGTGLSAAGTYDGLAARTFSVAYGTSGSTACVGNDSRLSDARTPTAHASAHRAGQSDDLLSSPGAIGGGTPAAGTFTTLGGTVLTASTRVDTPTIGTASGAQHALPTGTGDLVSVDASQTLTNKSIAASQLTGDVALARISTALASPGAIGGSTPAAGTFTALAATSGLTISTGQQLTAGANNLLLSDKLSAAALLIASQATGDMLYATSSSAWGRRGIGSEGQVWTVVSGVPDWADAAGGGTGLTQAQTLKLVSFRG